MTSGIYSKMEDNTNDLLAVQDNSSSKAEVETPNELELDDTHDFSVSTGCAEDSPLSQLHTEEVPVHNASNLVELDDTLEFDETQDAEENVSNSLDVNEPFSNEGVEQNDSATVDLDKIHEELLDEVFE